eukprot:gene57872-biopygen47981
MTVIGAFVGTTVEGAIVGRMVLGASVGTVVVGDPVGANVGPSVPHACPVHMSSQIPPHSTDRRDLCHSRGYRRNMDEVSGIMSQVLLLEIL